MLAPIETIHNISQSFNVLVHIEAVHNISQSFNVFLFVPCNVLMFICAVRGVI